MGTLQKPCPGGKMTKSNKTKSIFSLFNGFTKISTSIMKSWPEVTPLVMEEWQVLRLLCSKQFDSG